jgi:hypothetical protein
LRLLNSGDSFALELSCHNLSTQQVQVVSAGIIPPGQWTHVAGSVTSDGVARLYVNGKAVAEKPFGGKIQFIVVWSQITKIGDLFSGYTGDLTGLRWWSRAATDAEVAAAAAVAP